jgi:hypothetical protein
MSQQQVSPVLSLDQGATTPPIAADMDTATATKRAVRARCQALRPAKMGTRDIRYVQAHYLPLSELAVRADRDLAELEALVGDGLIPQPSYVLPDGTGMFPPDHLTRWDAATGVADLPKRFRVRYQAAAAAQHAALADGEAEQAWIDYLSGIYGACLKQVTPETILDKGIQTERIETLLADPHPDDRGWLSALRVAVDRLDTLERPFTGFDRRRFGHPTSRDRLITAVRRNYPQISRRRTTDLSASMQSPWP